MVHELKCLCIIIELPDADDEDGDDGIEGVVGTVFKKNLC